MLEDEKDITFSESFSQFKEILKDAIQTSVKESIAKLAKKSESGDRKVRGQDKRIKNLAYRSRSMHIIFFQREAHMHLLVKLRYIM